MPRDLTGCALLYDATYDTCDVMQGLMQRRCNVLRCLLLCFFDVHYDIDFRYDVRYTAMVDVVQYKR
jgi:hypothetical protein